MGCQGWYEIDIQQKARGYKIMSHTVDMKNVVGSYKEFFAYCNALETYGVIYEIIFLELTSFFMSQTQPG